MRQSLIAATVILASIGTALGLWTCLASASATPIQLPANESYQFGQLAFSGSGNLYFVDMQHSQIDEVVNFALKIIISMPKVEAPSNAIPGIGTLSITGDTIWFSANGGLYKATLDGRDVQHVNSVPGVVDVDALPNGDVVYSVNSEGSASGVFERSSTGATKRIAGGSTHGRYCAFGYGQLATSVSAEPTWILALTPDALYYVDETELCLVSGGRVYGLGHDFFNGELAAGPHGIIYSICDWAMCRVDARSYRQIFKLQTRINGDFAAPFGMAVSPSGTIYLSYGDQGGGQAGILRLSLTGRPTVLLESGHS